MRDVIVVGSGGGGAVVAKELASRGLDVLVLEAGPWYKHSDREFTHYELDMNDAIGGAFRWGPGDRTKSPWARELPQSSQIAQVAGVGGTTQHYFGNCPRAYPGIFHGYTGRDQSTYDRAHEFPFTYDSFVPYYEWVEHTLPVQTAAMGTKEEIFLNAAAKIGLPHATRKTVATDAHRPQENAILQPSGTAGKSSDDSQVTFPKAKGCTFCGHCYQGCYMPHGAPRNLKAKRSTDNSYIPMALTARAWSRHGKAITLRPNSFAIKVHTHNVGGQTMARAVTWRDTVTGATGTEEAKVVVLAAGCIETPRLWLNSNLPNPNGWVGRGITDHEIDLVVGIMPFDAGFTRGAASAARADFPGRGMVEQTGLPPASAAQFGAFTDAGIVGMYTNGTPATPAGADGMGRAAGVAFKQLMSNVDHLIGFVPIADDDVEPQNAVTLSTTFPPDEHGPVARIASDGRRRSRRSFENREFLARKAVEMARAAGAVAVFRVVFPPLFLHMQNSMRMGNDAANSVLDPGCESRWVKGLFVADHSALPNGVAGVNPTLTSQALATRTAEKIAERYFDGEGWVHAESPVSSIDPKVTHAVMKLGL